MTLQSPDASEQLAQLGKGLVQINLRLGRLGEAIEERRATPGEVDSRALDALLDLVDATGDALDRRGSTDRQPGLLARLRRSPEREADLWRGIALAHAGALERLRGMGIEPISCEAELDPALHRVVEVRPAPTLGAAGRIAACHRRGWTRRRAGETLVLREAHVSVFEDRRERQDHEHPRP